MKIILLLLLPVFTSAQFYSKVELQVAENVAGPALSIGALTKSGAYFGAGALAYLSDEPYVPIFFEFGFTANDKVIFPSAQIRIGQWLTNSQPFDSEYQDPGLYLDARIGVAYRPNKKIVRIIPYVGYSSLSVTKGYEEGSTGIGYLNFGVSFMFVRAK